MRQEEENYKQIQKNLNSQIQNNECQLRSEEAKQTSTRKEHGAVIEKIRMLESEKEPEPTDVLALVCSHIYVHQSGLL